MNPADSPIFMIALTSERLTKGQMYDAASTIMAQKLSQINGVGQVIVGGSSLPGVRVELNPMTLNKYGIGLEEVRSVLTRANANMPKGHFSDGQTIWEVGVERSDFQGGRLRAADRRLSQRRARCASPTSAKRSIRWRICATRAMPTASLRCW